MINCISIVLNGRNHRGRLRGRLDLVRTVISLWLRHGSSRVGFKAFRDIVRAEDRRRNRGLQAQQDEARRKSAAKANTERGKNGIIHAMKPHAKSALFLALAIVGGIAAGLRCDASEWVDNPSQCTPRGAAYTVKTYIEGSDPFDARMERFLDEYDIFVRNNSALRIVRAVLADECEKMDGRVYSRNVFGITSDEHGTEKAVSKSDLFLLNSEKGNNLTCSYISPKKVLKNADIIDKYKVIIGKVVPRNGEVGVDPAAGYRAITTVHIVSPGQVFTESYLLLATFDSLKHAENFARFMTCKFPRFVLHETYSSMNITKGNFRFVPFLDFNKTWTDSELYERYHCSAAERKMIDSMIRPLEYIVHEGKRTIKKSTFAEEDHTD